MTSPSPNTSETPQPVKLTVHDLLVELQREVARHPTILGYTVVIDAGWRSNAKMHWELMSGNLVLEPVSDDR